MGSIIGYRHVSYRGAFFCHGACVLGNATLRLRADDAITAAHFFCHARSIVKSMGSWQFEVGSDVATVILSSCTER